MGPRTDISRTVALHQFRALGVGLTEGFSLTIFAAAQKWSGAGEMQTPWSKYPGLQRNSIGWRMGDGEDYYNQFYQWFSRRETAEQTKFMLEYPEPSDWEGFYQTIISHPWL